MVTSVIGKAVRHGKPWVYVDLSIYAGLLEVRDGWSYPLETEKDHLPKQPTMLAGPTCDSTDVLAVDADLPTWRSGILSPSRRPARTRRPGSSSTGSRSRR